MSAVDFARLVNFRVSRRPAAVVWGKEQRVEDCGCGLADWCLFIIHLLGCCMDVENYERVWWTGKRGYNWERKNRWEEVSASRQIGQCRRSNPLKTFIGTNIRSGVSIYQTEYFKMSDPVNISRLLSVIKRKKERRKKKRFLPRLGTSRLRFYKQKTGILGILACPQREVPHRIFISEQGWWAEPHSGYAHGTARAVNKRRWQNLMRPYRTFPTSPHQARCMCTCLVGALRALGQ